MQIEILNLKSKAEIEKNMEKIGVTQEGIQIMTPKYIFLTIKLKNIRSVSANILKQEMLSLGGEAAVSRNTVNCKNKETDVLLGGTLHIYQKLCRKLKIQVLGLQEIGEEINLILNSK